MSMRGKCNWTFQNRLAYRGVVAPLAEKEFFMSEDVTKSKEQINPNAEITAAGTDGNENGQQKTKSKGGLPVAITFSYRKFHVRIYKSVLVLIGNPPYVRVLVNRDTKIVCIQGRSQRQRDDIPVPEKFYSTRMPFGFNSKAFVSSITDIMGWKKDRSYRITGTYSKEGNLVEFPLTEAIEILHENDEEN